MKKTVYFLLIFIVGIMYSCKEDEGIIKSDSHDKHSQRYKRSIISYQDMKSKLSVNSGQSIALFDNVANKDGDDYIQAIDTTHIIQYSNDTLTTYTMRVITLDDENYSYSNLIIRTLNGETEEFIAHYTPTIEWQEAFDNGEYLEYEGAFDLSDTNGNSILFGNEEGSQARGGGCWGIETTWEACYGVTCPCTDGNGTMNYNVVYICGPSGGGSGGGGNTGVNPDLPTYPVGGGGGGSNNSGNTSAFDIGFLGNLTQNQLNWLDARPALKPQFQNYLQSYGQPNNQNGWYENFYAVQFAIKVVNFLMANPQTVYSENFIERLQAIEHYLYNHPYAISDIPCSQIPEWQDVAQHQVPTSVKNKLQQLNQNNSSYNYDWAIQSIEDANGSLVNNDYFAVTFNMMPYKPFPNQNQQFTPAEFLRHVRTNINDFVNNNYSHFSPSTITGYNETTIWNSNNPIEAIIHIDIPQGHDGSVITTGHQINTNGMGGFSNGHWVFTTIQTPWYDVFPGGDGPHPVSGHRKFGLKKNAGGSYTLYTRGVDRFQGELGFVILDDALAENLAFPGADQLWQSFQQGLKNYIQANSYGNTVTVNTPVKWRPNWANVRDVLINNKPLSNLGCN